LDRSYVFGFNLAIIILIIKLFTYLFSDHLEKVELVLQRLQKAGLKVNVMKSFFAGSQLEHLGHWIARTGIKPVYDKINVG